MKQVSENTISFLGGSRQFLFFFLSFFIFNYFLVAWFSALFRLSYQAVVSRLDPKDSARLAVFRIFCSIFCLHLEDKPIKQTRPNTAAGIRGMAFILAFILAPCIPSTHEISEVGIDN